MIQQKQKPLKHKEIGEYIISLFGKSKKFGYEPELRIREKGKGILVQHYCKGIQECKHIFNRLESEEMIKQEVARHSSQA